MVIKKNKYEQMPNHLVYAFPDIPFYPTISKAT